MRWRNGQRPQCGSCLYFDTKPPRSIGGSEMARLYTQEEEEGGVCTRASTPFRMPADAVCACYEGPSIPWWANLLGPYTQLRVRAALAKEALDSLAQVRDDAAVLRCALNGVWRRANEARARSHELWAFLRPALADGTIQPAPVWRDRFINATTIVSRMLSTLGDMSVFKAIKEAGVKNLGIVMPERDTGRTCERCEAPLNTVEHVDETTGEIICAGCARKIGLLGDEQRGA